MPADAELRHAVLHECRRSELVGALAYVIQLVFDQRASFEIAAFERVVRVERDQERSHSTEPFAELLFLPGALPAADSDHRLFALADNAPHLADVLDGRSEVCDVGVDQVRVILVVQRRALAQECMVHPVAHAVGRYQVAKPVRAVEELIRWRWPTGRQQTTDCSCFCRNRRSPI